METVGKTTKLKQDTKLKLNKFTCKQSYNRNGETVFNICFDR